MNKYALDSRATQCWDTGDFHSGPTCVVTPVPGPTGMHLWCSTCRVLAIIDLVAQHVPPNYVVLDRVTLTGRALRVIKEE